MAHDEQDVPNTIYTVGHSNHSLAFFLELLHRHDIEVLIDTRSSPFSRYAPQFNRDALKSAILDAGIKYGSYGRELGGRPENTDFYDAAGRADYAQIAASKLFQSGLTRLVAGSVKHRVALLCSEENPSVCHRRLLISRVLFEAGLSIAHIRGDGRLETEADLREVDAAFAEDQKRRQDEKRASAEHKLQALEDRRAMRRALTEALLNRKIESRREAELARLEKTRQRQAAAEQRTAERKRSRVETQARKKTAAPKLFDMEEV